MLERHTYLRVKKAAGLMGVSDDTVRRWIASGAFTPHTDSSGRTVISGEELAQFARRRAPEESAHDASVARSARNQFVGLVTEVRSDPVMSLVRMQCGPFEVSSLMSTEAVDQLGLAPGVVATAVVKATMVIIERRDDQWG